METSTMPASLRDELAIIQFDRLRQRIPILYVVLAMISAGAGLASQGDFPIALQLAMPILMLVASIWRCHAWIKRRKLVVSGEEARRYLRRVNMLSIILMGASSIWAASSFLITVEASRALVIIFIFLAASACASSLASLPSAAILSLIVGLAPTSLAMFISGDVRLIALAANVIAVSIFQSRLIIGQFREMVRNLELQTDLEALANTDSLTGLHNRRSFSKLLEDRVSQYASSEFAIAMLDLDGFKPVNDRFGHAAGDEVLIALANRLRGACQPGDHVARIGGDEFAIIFGHERSGAVLEDGIAAIGSVLAEPYLIDGHHVFVSASIGTASFPASANTVNGLLNAADSALYIVKSGRNAVADKAASSPQGQSARRAA
ncbi:GGDEF domain-containing protein [Aquisediminimonas profunda]|uniref:GGDEF domain-containing protein n=1 Tax=Aquisediminimonas profunda TaxID=1550733 RepID=UPI001C62ACFD|nr:diguanylate cyclase [Aquisediminimonas profunda]